MNTIRVSLQERSYDVLIGCDLLPELHRLVEDVQNASQYFFVVDEQVEATHGDTAMQAFGSATKRYALQASEQNKTMSVVAS